ncbi:glycoside hydrolase family 24 protein [Paraburkholderia unamae]|uniref:Muramidase (Phage lysozyme) n=1 Tax=Paraburkholderia unamae TaxID=219649 RepID=A0ABX5KKM0_9BURK|nr:glycoside hydrolase family 104 protein [Paraburkholderia unamae]PVX80036.1 muramidase (phage lysozyme) [Paraburkholderia unamae]
MARISADAAGGPNIVAFLDMIAASEIDAYTLAHSDDGYNVLVGSHGPMIREGKSIAPDVRLFGNYVAHPNILNRELNSTAAGRYQLLARYFQPYATQLHLPDFSPVSQDLIAIQQIRERKAIPLILDGQITLAIYACSPIWASLPGNSYGQHQNAISMLVAAYREAGGKVALA